MGFQIISPPTQRSPQPLDQDCGKRHLSSSTSPPNVERTWYGTGEGRLIFIPPFLASQVAYLDKSLVWIWGAFFFPLFCIVFSCRIKKIFRGTYSFFVSIRLLFFSDDHSPPFFLAWGPPLPSIPDRQLGKESAIDIGNSSCLFMNRMKKLGAVIYQKFKQILFSF